MIGNDKCCRTAGASDNKAWKGTCVVHEDSRDQSDYEKLKAGKIREESLQDYISRICISQLIIGMTTVVVSAGVQRRRKREGNFGVGRTSQITGFQD